MVGAAPAQCTTKSDPTARAEKLSVVSGCNNHNLFLYIQNILNEHFSSIKPLLLVAVHRHSENLLNMSFNKGVIRRRCVLLLGKCGAGKSTIANHLVGHNPLSMVEPPFRVSEQEKFGSGTREVNYEIVSFNRDEITYEITVIDTAGYFIRDQDTIFDKMEDFFLRNHIEAINLIIFVFRKGRFTKEEQDVFSFVRERFKAEISPISALAITCCENDDHDARQGLIREFYSNTYIKDISNKMEMGIYPVGFPPVHRMMPQLQQAYKPIMERDREALISLAVTASKPYLTKNLFPGNRGCTIQ